MSTLAKPYARLRETALRQRRAIILSGILCWSSAFILPGLAQTLGEITGEVWDPTDSTVPGATVTATHKTTATRRITASNSSGVYRLPSLQPGLYEVRVEKEGFRTLVHNEIELHVQQSARVDFHLQIGTVKETVEVAGGQSVIAMENATVGTVINSRPIADLPLNGRNYLQLVALSPNVTFGFPNSHLTGSISRQGGSRVEQHISIAGQRDAFTHFTLDGVENTDVNFNTYVVLPSIDALQEFKVQSGVYPAEFGRQTGQVNVSTKSGTNQFHGSLFEFLRNDKLDAKAYAFTINRPPKEPFKWNQYGYTIGGPVWIPRIFNGRNRLFFLSSFEGYRDRKQIRGAYNVPSIGMRNGDFSELLPRTVIYDPATRTRQPNGNVTALPFPGNVIPKNLLHPTSASLLEFYPEPNVTTTALTSNYQIGQGRSIDKDQFLQRVDWVERSASQWFARFSWGDEQQVTEAMRLNGSKLLTDFRQLMASNTRVLSPNLVNEFRFGYNSFFNSIGHELAFTRDVVSELKIPGLQPLPPAAWGIPEIRVAGLGYFGNLAEGPYVNDNRLLQFVNNVSWIRGKHSFRVGVEIRSDRYHQQGNSGVQGRFSFDGLATQNPVSRPGSGDGFADYFLGLSSTSQGAVALAVGDFRAMGQSYYADDTWKIRPNVTIHMGLRYERTPPWLDRSGTLINAHIPFDDVSANVQDLSRHPTLVRIGTGDFYEGTVIRFHPDIKVARDGRLGERLVAPDNNDFAPRLGIAWSSGNRWNLRAGAGLFYAQDIGNARFDMSRNIAGRRTDTTDPEFPDLPWDQPFRNLGGAVEIRTPFVLANIHQRRTPYTLQYLFNVQREVGKDMYIEAGYLGSVSRKLESLRLFNQPLPSATGSAQSRAPYPELGLIQAPEGNGKARYNSFMVKAHRRFSQGATFLSAYTWSKAIDTGSAIRVHNGQALFPQDNHCVRCERGLSSFHSAHRFVTSGLFELPFGKGKKYANGSGIGEALIGGWQAGSILTLQSGFPFSALLSAQRSNTTGFISDRPNATGQSMSLPRGQQDPERFFNTGAFAIQPFGSFGNAGRNVVTGPGVIAWDFSAIKNFRVGESQQLQFRFEAFNLPNHPNWDMPGFLVDRVDFGKVRGTRTPMRELQFGLKYVF